MEPEKKINGAVIGLIIIILILLVGGAYMWQQSQTATPAPNEEVITEEELNTLEDDVNSVETDIEVDVNSVE